GESHRAARRGPRGTLCRCRSPRTTFPLRVGRRPSRRPPRPSKWRPTDAGSTTSPGFCRYYGTEFTSKALDHWAYWNRLQLDFSRPGKPVDNTFIEAFNGTLRRECLSSHWFLNLEDLQRTLEIWQDDYNKQRPHSSLADVPPAEFRAGGGSALGRSQLETSPV